MSRVRKVLVGIWPLKAVYHMVRTKWMSFLSVASPELLSRLRFLVARGRLPDLRTPVTFDEKLLWLNLHWRHPLKVECGDKYTMRGYVERLGLGHLLPRLYGVFESADAIDFGALPEQFVLKCTHGAKANVFCRKKSDLHMSEARRNLAEWMATDHSRLLGELHYAAMKPRIICEELLEDGTGEFPTDYKVYCFSGRPDWVLCCFDRRPNGNASFALVDENWTSAGFLREELTAQRDVPRPAALDEMLSACETLAAPFPFVRVDFYSIRGRAVLGEMTFTPDACIDNDITDFAQLEIGRRIDLPTPYTA